MNFLSVYFLTVYPFKRKMQGKKEPDWTRDSVLTFLIGRLFSLDLLWSDRRWSLQPYAAKMIKQLFDNHVPNSLFQLKRNMGRDCPWNSEYWVLRPAVKQAKIIQTKGKMVHKTWIPDLVLTPFIKKKRVLAKTRVERYGGKEIFQW